MQYVLNLDLLIRIVENLSSRFAVNGENQKWIEGVGGCGKVNYNSQDSLVGSLGDVV